MTCPHCGERLIGDGYRTPLHCPNADEDAWWYAEPDVPAIYCPLIYVSEWKEKGAGGKTGPTDR